MQLRQSLIICSFLIKSIEKTSQREAKAVLQAGEVKWRMMSDCLAHPESQEQSPGLSDTAEQTFYKTGSFSSVTWHEAQSGFSLWILTQDMSQNNEIQWTITWSSLNQAMHCVNISANLFGSALWSLDMCLKDKSHKPWALCSLSWSTVCSDVCAAELPVGSLGFKFQNTNTSDLFQPLSREEGFNEFWELDAIKLTLGTGGTTVMLVDAIFNWHNFSQYKQCIKILLLLWLVTTDLQLNRRASLGVRLLKNAMLIYFQHLMNFQVF